MFPGLVRAEEVAKDLLADELRLAIGIHPSERRRLGDWNTGRIAVDCRGGAEHHGLHTVCDHRFAQGQRAGDVVLVVLEWLGHRLTHRLEGRKVNDRFDRVPAEDIVQCRTVQQIDTVKSERSSPQFLGAPNGLRLAVAVVVHHHHVVAGLQELHRGVTADESRAAGNQNPHHRPQSRGVAPRKPTRFEPTLTETASPRIA